MTRSALSLALLATAWVGLACEGREVTVFELPAKVDNAGSSGAGGVAGAMTAPAGASAGGSVADFGGVGPGGSPPGGAGVGGPMGFGTGGAMAAIPCTSKADCAGWACDKKGCDQPTGVCVPWPPFCLPNLAPVCGCDGVTYWNDCLRLQADVTLAGPDQCRANACSCEVGADCDVPYASCSHLLGPGEMCRHGMGNCWVLPPQCDPNVDTKMWRECRPADPATPPKCLNNFEAIASEHTYGELHRGDTCN
jgi:hypothetical protein